MNMINRVTVLIFCAFLVAPLLSLVLLGYHSQAQNPPNWDRVEYTRLIFPQKNYRQQIARRTLTSTPAGMAAITAKSLIDYRIFGFVDASGVISGVDGWLFYKPSFRPEWCNSGLVERALGNYAVLSDLAEGAGFRYLLSVSADKSSVVPEKLGRQAGALAERFCKSAAMKHWRTVAETTGVIDHLSAIPPDKRDVAYPKLDTHWTDYGRALAMQQLAIEALGVDPGAPGVDDGEATRTSGDLARLLNVRLVEPTRSYRAYWEDVFNPSLPQTGPTTLIFHDSFYRSASRQLAAMFPELHMLHFNSSPADKEAALSENPELIIANSVERLLVERLRGVLSTNSEIGTSITERNRNVADSCSYVPAESVRFRRMEKRGTRHITGDDPQILIDLPEDSNCVRVSFSTVMKGRPVVFLPALNGRFSGNHSFHPKRDEIRFVLPDRYRGSTIRIDPIPGEGSISGLTIEVGKRRGSGV